MIVVQELISFLDQIFMHRVHHANMPVQLTQLYIVYISR